MMPRAIERRCFPATGSDWRYLIPIAMARRAIWSIHIDGSSLRKIAKHAGGVAYPVASPVDDRVVFSSTFSSSASSGASTGHPFPAVNRSSSKAQKPRTVTFLPRRGRPTGCGYAARWFPTRGARLASAFTTCSPTR